MFWKKGSISGLQNAFWLNAVLSIHNPCISWLLSGTKNHEIRGPPVICFIKTSLSTAWFIHNDFGCMRRHILSSEEIWAEKSWKLISWTPNSILVSLSIRAGKPFWDYFAIHTYMKYLKVNDSEGWNHFRTIYLWTFQSEAPCALFVEDKMQTKISELLTL